MKCTLCVDLLPEWIDQDLQDHDSAEVESHLALCPTCAQHACGLLTAKRLVQFASRVEPPASLLAGIRERAQAEGLLAAPASRRWRPFLRRAVPLWAAAASLMVGVALAWSLGPREKVVLEKEARVEVPTPSTPTAVRHPSGEGLALLAWRRPDASTPRTTSSKKRSPAPELAASAWRIRR